MATSVELDGEDATRALGQRLGREVIPGDVLALVGDLGAGKTTLTQGLARGLGIPEAVPVISPTYTLVRSYAGRIPLHHLDLYRLGQAEELAELGFSELVDGGGVVVVEWADRFPEALPPESAWLTLEWAPGGGRLASLRAPEASRARLEAALLGSTGAA